MDVQVQLGPKVTGLGSGLVVGVADQPLKTVDPDRRPAPGHSSDHLNDPDTQMNLRMVTITDQGEIGEIAASAVAEEPHVMRIAAGRRR